MKSAGFTLLELLIAMVLLAMVSTLALGGLRAGTRVWDRTERVAEEQATDLALAGFLERLLAGVVAAQIRDGTRTPPILFRGDDRAMVFVAPLPSALAAPGEHLVGLSIMDGEDGDILRLQWRPLGQGRLDLAIRPSDPGAVLTEGLSSARFAYGAGGRKHQSWPLSRGLPEFIEIERLDTPLVVRLPPKEAEA